MAYGRRDYWRGVAPEKSVYGELQTPWNHGAANNVNATSSLTILTYNIPVGYQLQITGFLFWCSSPLDQYLSIEVDGVPKIAHYMNGELNMMFGEGGNYIVTGGKQLTIVCTNYDTVIARFSIRGYGFLEQILV